MSSRTEAILENILGADNVIGAPQSRIEAILQNILGDDNEVGEPKSRIEALLIEIWKNGMSNSFAGEAIQQLNGGTSYVCGYAEPST